MKTYYKLSRTLTVKKKIATVFFAILIAGCSSVEEETADDIRQQISEYQSTINEMTLKVSQLERQLELMGESTQSQNKLPVSIIRVEESDFKEFFTATATLEAVQTAIISPETSGQIREILVRKGQSVQKGQVLARLNTNVINSNIEEVKTNLGLANTVYQRQKGLWEQQIGSEIQFLEARNALESLENKLKTLESQLEMSVLRAPFTGIIDDIFLQAGELAMPGLRVMIIVNMQRLYVNADISEKYIGKINRGDTVMMRSPAYPDKEMNVPVHRVGNIINPENRTFQIQLIIDNPNGQFKPNMLASLAINTRTVEDALVIPSILIRQDLQGHYVYLAVTKNGEMAAEKKYIERGADGEGQTMVVSGLQAGDLLINRGHNQVIDGSLIRIDDNTSILNPISEGEHYL